VGLFYTAPEPTRGERKGRGGKRRGEGGRREMEGPAPNILG